MAFTFSHVASLVIVTELQSLVDSCGSAAGHGSSEQTWKSQEGFETVTQALVLNL